jgi:hypothetical protein
VAPNLLENHLSIPATQATTASPTIFSVEALADRIAKTTHQAIHQAVTAALRSIPPANDSTDDEPHELDDIGQDATMQGKRYARCWDVVQGTDEFRAMPIVDYRDGTAAWAWGVVTDAGMFEATPEGRFVFTSPGTALCQGWKHFPPLFFGGWAV